MVIADRWLRDLPQQFQSKEKIETLIKAFSKQMQEIYDVFDTMEYKTSIDGATGVNLDYCGQNVGLTRKQALSYLEKGENYEVTDEVYRNALKFKILENTCDATYPNIMEGLRLLWDTENIEYKENESRPATYILSVKKQPIENPDVLNGRTLTLRGAGINAVFQITYVGSVENDFPTDHVVNVATIRSPMYTGVRKLDGTFKLDGTYKLDAMQDSTAAVLSHAYAKHVLSVSLAGVYDVPDRVILTSNTATAEGYDDSGMVGQIAFADEASMAFADDGMEITYQDDAELELEFQSMMLGGKE